MAKPNAKPVISHLVTGLQLTFLHLVPSTAVFQQTRLPFLADHWFSFSVPSTPTTTQISKIFPPSWHSFPQIFLPLPQHFFTPQNVFPSQLHPGWNSPLDQIILTWYVTSHHRESWSNWCSNTTPLHTVSFFPFTLQVFVHTYLAKKVSATLCKSTLYIYVGVSYAGKKLQKVRDRAKTKKYHWLFATPADDTPDSFHVTFFL